MLAIINCARRALWPRASCVAAALPRPVALALLLAGFAPALFSEPSDPPPSPGALRTAEKAFRETRAHFEESPGSAEKAWEFGRACFDLADLVTNNKDREQYAVLGIAACRKALERDGRNVAAHYYLGMNLGQLARTKSLGALKLVSEMEREFKTAREIDARYDFAGPDRNLGLLYREAPGWPTSIGSKTKARQHLEAAVQVSPDYPENRLNLADAYLKWGERAAVEAQFNALDQLWPRAQKEFRGETWAPVWSSWERRLRKLKEKFNVGQKSVPAKK